MASKKGKPAGSAKPPLPKFPIRARLITLVARGQDYVVGNIVRFGPATYGDRPAIRVNSIVLATGAILTWELYGRGSFDRLPKQPLQDTTTGLDGTGAGITVVWEHAPAP